MRSKAWKCWAPLVFVVGVGVFSFAAILQMNPHLQSFTGSDMFQAMNAKISTKDSHEREQGEREARDEKSAGYDQSESFGPLNIVLLYADDWSFETLGAMGNKYVKTPAVDQMAKEGVLFSHNCVTTSICMQSRATLYTGQYSSRHQTLYSWRSMAMYKDGKWANTLYPLMVKAGYYVGFYGKYHHSNPPREIPTFSEFRNYHGSHYQVRGGVEKHITQLAEEDGMEFLEKRPKDKPFFLTLSFFATHAEDGSQEQYRPMNSSMHLYQDEPVPLPKTFTEQHWQDMPYFFDRRNFGRGRFLKRYRTPELYQHHMKNTLRMATEVDTVCGRILDKLKEQDLLNNTLVIFTTDNGNMHGHHGLAEKWYAYEESIRVPLVIKDPRMHMDLIGTTNDEFTLNIDLAPTILTAAGVTPPDEMQGRDMAQLYLNPVATAKTWRKEFFYEFRNDNAFIPNNIALVRKDSKFIYWENQNYTQYFDLLNDPKEEKDIINQTHHNTLFDARRRMEELEAIAKASNVIV